MATSFVVAVGNLDEEEVGDEDLAVKGGAEARMGRRAGSRVGSCGALCLAGDCIATRFCTVGCVADRDTVGLTDLGVE